jgi:hypothetical protein
LVTTTFTVPAECAGVVQVTALALTHEEDAHADPSTATPKAPPEVNPVPVMVISLPPAVEPCEGDTPEIVGAGAR